MEGGKRHFLARRQVIRTIEKAIQAHPLTVVTAPMGYGKTTTARSLQPAAFRNTFYFAVPRGPLAPDYLWDALFEKLESQALASAQDMRRLGFPDTPAGIARAIGFLSTNVQSSLLIIDDYHHCTDPAFDTFLEALAQAMTPGLALVVFSRSKPGFNLDELRLKKVAAVFDQRLLAFSRSETEAYLANWGLSDADAALEAWEYSEGWPAALWLYAQNWRNNGCSPPKEDVAALLEKSVFASYSAEEKRFLTRLSALDRFTPAEARKVTSDPLASNRLRRVLEKNAFLVHDRATGYYQFHSIFRDFLEGELSAMPARARAQVYRRAAECHAERGELILALRLLSRTGSARDQLRILKLCRQPRRETLFSFFLDEVRDTILAMPWTVRLKDPIAYLAFLHAYLTGAGDARNAGLLKEAEERFRRAKFPPALSRHLRGEIWLLRLLPYLNDSRTVLKYARNAQKLLTGPSTVLLPEMSYTFGSPSFSFAFVAAPGRFAGVLRHAAEVEEVCRASVGGYSVGAAALAEAEFHLERGEFDQVAPLLEKADRQARPYHQTATRLAALFCRARLRLAGGDAAGAFAPYDDWLPRIQALDNIDHARCVDMGLGYLHAVLGQADRVPLWLRTLDTGDKMTAQNAGFQMTVYGKTLLAAGEFESACEIASEIPSHLPWGNSLFGAIHSAALQAVALLNLRGAEAAAAPFAEALDLTRADGLVLSVAEYGGWITPLLAGGEHGGDDPHLKAIAALARRMARLGCGPGGEPREKNRLTARERQFMALVAKGRTNASIARKHGVAEVTVRKALVSIYKKLGAGNRVQAVREYERLKSAGKC